MTSYPVAFVTELLHILFWYRIIIGAIVQPGKETGIKDEIVIDITGTFFFLVETNAFVLSHCDTNVGASTHWIATVILQVEQFLFVENIMFIVCVLQSLLQ